MYKVYATLSEGAHFINPILGAEPICMKFNNVWARNIENNEWKAMMPWESVDEVADIKIALENKHRKKSSLKEEQVKEEIKALNRV